MGEYVIKRAEICTRILRYGCKYPTMKAYSMRFNFKSCRCPNSHRLHCIPFML
uniref:Uncharacterized protein n=1 Tax=Anguilla anguilla TaxID=7936 RepID=A0A0E9SBG5_ANGAN